jgi:glucokinase
MILAGDIGGTKTVLASYQLQSGTLVQLREETFKSGEHASLEEIVARFRGNDAYVTACFGVAGPVVDGECRTTNLPWVLRESDLAVKLGARRVKLLNDLEAASYGMLHLEAGSVLSLQDGSKVTPGTIAVLAAGTGLGEAILYWDGARYLPLPSEGGHATFAPQTPEEQALRDYLAKTLNVDHVSFERVVSGPAFAMIYDFLGGTALRDRFAKENPAAVITSAGLANEDPIARRTVELFAECYGAEAGNHALKVLALGGVFLGGNIAKVLFPTMRDAFMRGFLHKGRFEKLLATLPVRVALDPKAPLIGAAHFGATL